jgi:hypothetical protein
MTQDELFKLWSEMRKQRVDERLLPYEPSPIEFGARVADIEYDRGFDDGWESRADAERAKDRDT